jgi:hypothetical protein
MDEILCFKKTHSL